MRAEVLPQQDGAPAERLREATESMRRQTNALPWSGGRAVTGITVGAATTKDVYHQLGHEPGGFFPYGVKGTDARISYSAWDSKTITLVNAGAASATFNIWIW